MALSPWRRRLAAALPFLPLLVAPLILALCWTAVSRLAGEVRYAELQAALFATPWTTLAAALLLTALSFAALVVYDLGALACVDRKLPLPVVALASFCAYAVGNTAGFGPLTAGAIRYRFYTPHGVEPEDLARIIAFVTAAFGFGLACVGGIGLLVAPEQLVALSLPPELLRLAGAAILLALAALCLAAGRGRELHIRSFALRLPSSAILARQYLASVIDISAAASVLWILLPDGGPPLPAFVALYAVAVALGVLSHVPGGLGVFETIMVTALNRYLPLDAVLSALVLYRVIYHLVPLAVAVLLLALIEARRFAATPGAAAVLRAGARLAPLVLGALALILGAVLVFSSVTPLDDATRAFLAHYLPLPVIEGAHFLSSLLGVALVIVARGLVYRLDGAWWAALLIVPLAIVLALAKAVALIEAGLLALLLVALLLTRAEFNRHASLLHQALTPGWLVATATLVLTAVALLFFVYKDVDYAHTLWWQFEFSEDAPRSLRALLGVLLSVCAGAAWILLRPARKRPTLPDAAELQAARAIVRAQPRADAGLVAMGDKFLMFSDDGRAFIMYGCQGRSWIALADPVGPRECWPELVWSFIENARASGGRAAFYQVSADALGLYADAGLRAFKLGEEARVILADFDLKGSRRAPLRHIINRAERDGLQFAILPAEDVGANLDALRAVSDAWVAEHKVREKRFSLGAFEDDYLRSQPVAVLRQEGRIIAFASLLLTDEKEEASIDLMRFLPGSPNGVMEFLLLSLILHFQREGHACFTLGMAPLAGLSASTAAPMWHRVGRMVFEHGERFYNFSGLRSFKSKFQPEWRPRYLAVAGGINPMLALADTTVLISGGLKGVISR